MTDTELIDGLEYEIKEQAMLLWDGHGAFPGGPRGLSLLRGERTLRQALEQLLTIQRAVEHFGAMEEEKPT